MLLQVKKAYEQKQAGTFFNAISIPLVHSHFFDTDSLNAKMSPSVVSVLSLTQRLIIQRLSPREVSEIIP